MDKKGERKSRALRMENLTNRYVPDNELRDPPARLFRQIINKMNMDPAKWGKYLRTYLEWFVTTEDLQRAKVERVTKKGNIQDTYFQKPNLTFNKFLEGLSILRMKSCKITFEVEDENGEKYVVSETVRIMSKNRLDKLPKVSPENDE